MPALGECCLCRSGRALSECNRNAVELLIAILALVKGDIDIVQASMVGSILSNSELYDPLAPSSGVPRTGCSLHRSAVLLVLGMSYFAGGLRFHEQIYGIIGAQMHISLLGISVLSIVLPAAYHYAYPSTLAVVDQEIHRIDVPEGLELAALLQMSRGLSFILLAVYAMFLCFQLWSEWPPSAQSPVQSRESWADTVCSTCVVSRHRIQVKEEKGKIKRKPKVAHTC
jgi:Ca2+:H+ antiporter